MTPSIKIISQALVQVEQVLAKSEGILNTLQQQLTQVTNQRIGLTAQKAMLVELKKAIESSEQPELTKDETVVDVAEVKEKPPTLKLIKKE
jgi:hypothetical protein